MENYEDHCVTEMSDVKLAMVEILVKNYISIRPHYMLKANIDGIFRRVKSGRLLLSEKEILSKHGFKFKEV